MQNPIQKFRQSSIVFEKPGILSGKLKTPTTVELNIFLLGFCTRLLFTNVYKRCSGFILFCLDLVLFAKIKKDLVSTHSLKPFLLITQDLNKIKKISEHSFVGIVK